MFHAILTRNHGRIYGELSLVIDIEPMTEILRQAQIRPNDWERA